VGRGGSGIGERGNWKRKWEVVEKSGGISRSGYGSTYNRDMKW
jgi:hypothetical protein